MDAKLQISQKLNRKSCPNCILCPEKISPLLTNIKQVSGIARWSLNTTLCVIVQTKLLDSSEVFSSICQVTVLHPKPSFGISLLRQAAVHGKYCFTHCFFSRQSWFPVKSIIARRRASIAHSCQSEVRKISSLETFGAQGLDYTATHRLSCANGTKGNKWGFTFPWLNSYYRASHP